MAGKLPDFIVCGFMKCATTVLWHNLNCHPDITMGKNYDDPKETSTEIRFWNKKFDKGLDWYKQWFTGECVGEKCANYAETPLAMERIAKYAPGTKIVLCIRNPVDRAYSHFIMRFKMRDLPDKFEDLLKSFPRLINFGMYHKMITENVMPFFHRMDIEFVVQEALRDNTDLEMNRLFPFLGVPPHHESTVDVTLKDRNLPSVGGYRRWRFEYPPMDSNTRAQLVEQFKTPNARLYDLLGHRINGWDE